VGGQDIGKLLGIRDRVTGRPQGSSQELERPHRSPGQAERDGQILALFAIDQERCTTGHHRADSRKVLD
jgi:hypothetical protein